MSHFVRDNMAPLMFAGLIGFMLIGYPAAFSLAAVGLAFGFLGIQLGLIEPNFLGNLTYQLFGIVSNDQGTLLLSIPFFTFMGAILERCGLAEDLLDSIGQLFGPVRGGLSYAVIFVGAILGAITGTVAASVIAMGVISMTIDAQIRLLDAPYDMGVIAASGTITQLIPPSLVLVVLADQLGRSVGDMYAGAIGPSIIQVAAVLPSGLLILAVVSGRRTFRHLPLEARTLHGWPLLKPNVCAASYRPLGAHIPRTRHDIRWALRHSDRSGRHGRGRRDRCSRRFIGTLTWPLLYQGMSLHDAHYGNGGLHFDRRARVQPGLPGRRRQNLDRGSPRQSAGRSGRIPPVCQRFHFCDRILSRFF